MKRYNYITALSVLIAVSACTTSGNNAITRTSAYPRVIEQARKDKSYFIMHSGLDTFAITSLLVEKNKQDFTVYLNKLDSARRSMLANPGSASQKLVHLYMSDSTSYTLDEPHTIPLKKVVRIEMNK
jgi:hypothetical protein